MGGGAPGTGDSWDVHGSGGFPICHTLTAGLSETCVVVFLTVFRRGVLIRAASREGDAAALSLSLVAVPLANFKLFASWSPLVFTVCPNERHSGSSLGNIREVVKAPSTGCSCVFQIWDDHC